MVITNNVPIRIRVVYAGKRVEFSTGYRIDTTKWDEGKQRVKNGSTNRLKQSASEINADLLKYYTDIQIIFKEFEVHEIFPTPEQVKEAFNQKNKKNKKETVVKEPKEAIHEFVKSFDDFIKECRIQNNWTTSTYKKFLSAKNHLMEFDANISFGNLDESKLTNYVILHKW